MSDYNHSRKGGSGNLNPPFLILTVNGFNPFQRLCNQDVSRLFPSWSAPIANGLNDPISFSFFWILISIGFPVSGIVDSPFLLTELLCDPIVRIGIHFDSLPIGFSGLLTLWTAAAILFSISLKISHQING